MKSMKVLAVAAAVALPLQFAQAADPSLNAQIVLPDVDGFDGGMGIALGYEIPMPNVHPNFTFEGEFTTTIDNPDMTLLNSPFGDINLEASYYTLAGYAKYTHPINQAVDIYGRVGLLYESVEVEYDASGDFSYMDGASYDDTDTGISFGFGVNVEISPSMDFTAGFTKVESDITHLSAGLKFAM